MDVVEVDQQELRVALQLLLVLLGLGLGSEDTGCRPRTHVGEHAGTPPRLTFSAIMFRKASNTLSATAITHCIIPVTQGRQWGDCPLPPTPPRLAPLPRGVPPTCGQHSTAPEPPAPLGCPHQPLTGASQVNT